MSELRHFTCNVCDALCGLDVTLDAGRIAEIRGDPHDVLSHGHVCPKGLALREMFEDPDRLRQPMRRTASGFSPVSWDEAFDEAAAHLRATRKAHGKDAVALYIGNPTAHSHRAAFGAQALNMALGTRNRFDPNSQDSAPRLFACMQMYGDGLSMAVPDVDRTDLLVMLGANPAASNASMMSMGDARKRLAAIRARRGRIVLFDPRRTETARWCDEHHFIRPGGDAALLLAMLHVLFTEGRIDATKVETSTSGLTELRRLAERFTPERVAPAIGVEAATLRRLALEIADTPRAAVYCRVGVCVSEFGPLVCWLVEAINVVTGHFDVEGGVMFPKPAADIGPIARRVVGNQYDRYRSRVRGLPEFLGSLPSSVMSEEMETPGDGQIRAFVCFAGNPVLSTPNGERLGRAIEQLDFVLSIDLYLNETSRLAHLVLPPAHVFQSGNYELFMLGLSVRNLAKYSPPILPRDGERDDWQILSELALRLSTPRIAHGAGRRALRDLPERIVDTLLRFGAYPGLSLKKLAGSPHGIDLGPLMPSKGRAVHTPDGRIRLAPPALTADVPRLERWLDAARAGLVLIGRRHLRSNNSWMHNLHSLVKGPDRSQLMMHPVDAAARGLADGSRVRIKSRTGEIVTSLKVTAELMPGVVSLPHGFGHARAADTLKIAGAYAGENINALTDELLVEPVVGTSVLNGVPVEVEAEVEAEGAAQAQQA